jgi:mitochondrial fission protein ELM1
MPTIKNNERFKIFFNLFISLNIIKELNAKVKNWTYPKLDETRKIADQIRKKIKLYDFS